MQINKKALTLTIISMVFFTVSLVLIVVAEVIAFYSFESGENIINYFLHSSRTPKTYTLISYGLAAMLAMDTAIRFFIYLCVRKKLGLSIKLAIELIDDESLQKLYLKKWIN